MFIFDFVSNSSMLNFAPLKYCLIACFVLAFHARLYTQPKTDRLYLIDSLKQSLTITKDTQRLEALLLLIEKTKLGDPDVAIKYGKEAQKLLEKIQSPSTKARGYKTVGNAYYYYSDPSSALFYYLLSLRQCESLKDTSSIILLYNNIGAIYIVVGRNDLAKKTFLIALDLGKKIGLPPNKFLNNNIGNLYFDEKNYDESIKYFKQSLAAEEQQDSNAIEKSIMLNNIAESYYIKGEIDSAELYFNKVLRMRNLDYYFIASAYSGLGKIATSKNNFSLAQTLLFKAEKMASTYKYIKVEVEVLKNLSALYAKQHQFEKALNYYMQYQTLSDSAYAIDMRKQVDELQVKYETQKKTEQINVLNKDKQLALAESENRGATRNLFMAAFIFTLVVSFALYRNNHLKKKLNTILSKTNARISEDNSKLLHDNIIAKYEVLKSKTDPHFLFNSLNTLSAIVIKDTAAVEYIKRFSDLYRMILETESKTLVSLQDEMQVVDHYLYLQKMRFREKLIIHTDIPAIYLGKGIPSFSIQMVVENAIKHNIVSRLRNLTINLYIEDDFVVVANNLQRKQEPVPSTFTGIKNIIDRYALLTAVPPVFTETAEQYIVKLPLLEFQSKHALTTLDILKTN